MHLFLELRIATTEFIVDITGKVLEASGWKGSKLLPGLVALRMKVVPHRQEGDCQEVRKGIGYDRGVSYLRYPWCCSSSA